MAEGRLGVGAAKTIKRTPTPPMRGSFIPGSRPPDLRAPAIQRIKPMAGQTQYGKAGGAPGTASAGNTGQTPWS